MPDVTPQQRKQNAVMTMKNGEKIKGALNIFNYETGQFQFTSKIGKIYDDPEFVHSIDDIWRRPLYYPQHIRELINNRYKLGLTDTSGDYLYNKEVTENQKGAESSYNPNAPDGTELLLNWMLDVYQESHTQTPSAILGGSGGSKGCHIYGKIKFVEYGEDYKVRFVDYGANLKVKYVEYGESSKGNWKMVEYGEDYKIKIVSYGEDLTVKTVSYGQGCN